MSTHLPAGSGSRSCANDRRGNDGLQAGPGRGRRRHARRSSCCAPRASPTPPSAPGGAPTRGWSTATSTRAAGWACWSRSTARPTSWRATRVRGVRARRRPAHRRRALPAVVSEDDCRRTSRRPSARSTRPRPRTCPSTRGRSRRGQVASTALDCLLKQEFVRDREKKPRNVEQLRAEIAASWGRTSPSGDSPSSSLARRARRRSRQRSLLKLSGEALMGDAPTASTPSGSRAWPGP